MSNHTSTSTRRRVLAWLTASTGWAVIVFLWVVTGFRVAAWDRIEVFAVLDAGTLILFLPAWIVAPLAAWRRHWALAVAALAMMVAQVIYVLPEFTASTALPGGALHAPTLRLFDANVYDGNPNMAG